MTTLKTFCLNHLKGITAKSLLLAVALLSFVACKDGLDDYYKTPTCTMTDQEKQTQKVLDIDSISDYFQTNNIDTTNMQKTASGIYYLTLSEGSGDLLKAGDKVQVHYLGKFLDGATFESSTTFDNSYNTNSPINIIIGETKKVEQNFIPVIAGWNEGLQLMKVGEETRFYIPSYLAYGKCGNAGIPANAVLAFDIKVIKKY